VFQRRSTVLAVAASLMVFVIVFLGEAAMPQPPSRRLEIALALSAATFIGTFVATRIFWNAPARAIAFLIVVSATCLSGILILARVHSPFGNLAGWSAIAASAACALMFTMARGSARDR
jgi:hypothetical protein